MRGFTVNQEVLCNIVPWLFEWTNQIEGGYILYTPPMRYIFFAGGKDVLAKLVLHESWPQNSQNGAGFYPVGERGSFSPPQTIYSFPMSCSNFLSMV